VGIYLAWKDFFKKVSHSAKVLGVNISYAAALSNKKLELKRVLLSRFKIKQLNEIASRKGVSLRRAKTKDAKIDILARELSFEEVVKLAKRYKIKYKDILEELDRFKSKYISKKAMVKVELRVGEILEALKDFKPEPVRDEDDLEKQLYQYLRARFPDLPIKRQVKVGDYRVDMQVGPVALELKIPRSATHLQRLMGQVKDYSDYFDYLVAVILDIGVVKNMNKYVERLAEQGYIPIVLKGTIKKK
jgi:hypothetical protein